MTTGVSAWKQAGDLYLWRYAAHSRSRRGWHFHADRDGCTSVADLVDRMVAERVSSFRTLKLARLTADISDIPGFGAPKGDGFDRLRLQYRPEMEALSLEPVDGKLVLVLGAKRAPLLRACFIDLMLGQNDFAIAPGDRQGDPWWFW